MFFRKNSIQMCRSEISFVFGLSSSVKLLTNTHFFCYLVARSKYLEI